MDKEIMEILKAIQKDINSMKGTLDEHTQLLRALEHKTDVISAEVINIKHDVAEVHGEVKSIRKDLSQVEMVTANNWADIAKLKAVK
jgi:chromosome segregation ATPase